MKCLEQASKGLAGGGAGSDKGGEVGRAGHVESDPPSAIGT